MAKENDIKKVDTPSNFGAMQHEKLLSKSAMKRKAREQVPMVTRRVVPDDPMRFTCPHYEPAAYACLRQELNDFDSSCVLNGLDHTVLKFVKDAGSGAKYRLGIGHKVVIPVHEKEVSCEWRLTGISGGVAMYAATNFSITAKPKAKLSLCKKLYGFLLKHRSRLGKATSLGVATLLALNHWKIIDITIDIDFYLNSLLMVVAPYAATAKD